MKNTGVNIHIKREKLLFAFPVILILIYIFTPWRPAQIISFFFIFIIVFSRIYVEFLIRSIRLFRRDLELRGFRHEWIDMELVIENRGRLPAFMIAIADNPGRLPVFRDNKCLLTLYGKRSIVMRWQGLGTSRGYFTLGPGIVHGADPLGLFPFTFNAGDTTGLYVYPAPGYVSLKAPAGIPLGVLKSNNPFNEDLTSRRSVREYTAGDELRRINWKTSARMSGYDGADAEAASLMINEYEASLSYPLVVFLNVDPAEYQLKYRELYLERAIEAAAALCIMASRDRQALGLVLYSSRKKVKTISPSAFALIPILEQLAIFERRIIEDEPDKGSDSADCLLKEAKALPFGTRIVYVGPALDKEDSRLFEGLKSSHQSLEYFLIDEKVLPRRSGQYQIRERGYEIL